MEAKMNIGCPKEIKNGEYRVGLTPLIVSYLKKADHNIFIEKTAGEASGFKDEDYASAGAIITCADRVWGFSDLIVKVKEPQFSEFQFLKRGLMIFTFLHLAAFPELTKALQGKEVTAIDYCTIQEANGRYPILAPMSHIAGELAIHEGARYLQKNYGGKGILLSHPAKVFILGGGNAGRVAAETAVRMGAKVVLVEQNKERCRFLRDIFSLHRDQFTCYEIFENIIEEMTENSDLVVGCVLLNSTTTPKIITEKMIKKMEAGSVIVDISIDEGGCIETAHPTSHKEPIFVKHGVIHYCVPNMPGMVPKTATEKLAKETCRFILFLAEKGEKSFSCSPTLAKGVNTYKGCVTHLKPALALNLSYTDLIKLL